MNANIWNRFSRRAPWRPPTAHLLHIGKTGGTAIKTALEHRPQGAHYTLAVHPHRFTLADVPASEYAVFFLRDPMSRFISGFHSRKRQGAPRYHFPWSPEEAMAFGRFDTPNDLALSLSSPDPDVRLAAMDGMRSIKHVRDGFAHWLRSVEYPRTAPQRSVVHRIPGTADRRLRRAQTGTRMSGCRASDRRDGRTPGSGRPRPASRATGHREPVGVVCGGLPDPVRMSADCRRAAAAGSLAAQTNDLQRPATLSRGEDRG